MFAMPSDLPTCQRRLEDAYRALEAKHRALEEQHRALEEQQRVLDQTAAAYEQLRHERDQLKDELRSLRQWVFGRRRERIPEVEGQQHLFSLPEQEPEAEPPQEPPPSTAPRRRRRQRRLDLSKLPHRYVPMDVPEHEKQCGNCGKPKQQIGTDERRELEYEPAKLEVVVCVLPKYACSCCKDGVSTPAAPPRPTPRCVAGPGLISQIVVSKFADHLPLYRQEDIFVRHGLYVPRSTLGDWTRSAADLMLPLYELQKQRVLQSAEIWTDDTPVRMLDPEAEGGSRQARFWVYLGDQEHPYSVFDFTPNHKRDGPAQFLADFRGCLHADAYGGYDGIEMDSNGAIVRVACGAHLRRKFVDAFATAPAECARVLEWFRQLYDIEDRARQMSAQERLELRQAESLPLLDRMKQYLDELADSALPKSALGKAVGYGRNQWAAFIRYTEDGRRTMDNNASERTLRAIASGRKNWQFLGHRNAGPRAAVLYTIVAGAKRHRMEPWAYIRDVLLQMGGGSEDLEALLPDRWAAAHPQHVLDHRHDEARQRRARQQAARAERRRGLRA